MVLIHSSLLDIFLTSLSSPEDGLSFLCTIECQCDPRMVNRIQ